MQSTPLHAPSVMHIFPYFFRFLFIFAKSSGCQPTRCGVDAEWVGCLGVENEKGTQNGKSTPPGPTLCAESNAHFSTFFLISVDFPAWIDFDKKTHPRVCLCEVFEKSNVVGMDGKNGVWIGEKGANPAGKDCIRLPCTRRVVPTFFHIFSDFYSFLQSCR